MPKFSFACLAVILSLNVGAPLAHARADGSAKSFSFRSLFFAPKDDAYAILGVSPKATAAEIQWAYRALAKVSHPDKLHDDGIKMAEINLAYARIENENVRRIHDYEEGYTARPADMTSQTGLADFPIEDILKNRPGYKAALEATLNSDKALAEAVSTWPNYPVSFRRSILPQLRSPSYWIMALFSVGSGIGAVNADSIPKMILFGSLATAGFLFPPAQVVLQQTAARPAPPRLMRDFAKALKTNADEARAAMITFDLLYSPLFEFTKHKYAIWTDVYVQLRLGKLARRVPEIALGQLLRFLYADKDETFEIWKATFENEMRSRPKYWLGQLPLALDVIKAQNLPSEMKVRAEAWEDILVEIKTSEAFKSRAKIHAKRSCEVMLQSLGFMAR